MYNHRYEATNDKALHQGMLARVFAAAAATITASSSSSTSVQATSSRLHAKLRS